MSGPPKKPTHLRLVQGNPSKRPVNKNEPKPKKRVPQTPSYLSKQAKYWFEKIAKELDEMGVMTQIDSKALELLVEAYSEYRKHCDVLDAENYTYTTGDGLIKAHPAAAMKADAWKRIRAMLSEFGMTPASRAKVSTEQADAVDPLEEFLKKRK